MLEHSLRLIESLERPECWPFEVTAVERVETHISWVLLTGEEAYKIRKPVDLGFLDFSTLARRDHYAHEEVRLNRRFAPELYLGVVRITGTVDAPRIDGTGPLLEVAVRMRQFEQARQLDRELAAGMLTPEDMVAVGREVAAFQEQAPRAESGDDFGMPEAVWAPVGENFTQIRAALEDASAAERLDALERISASWAGSLREEFQARRAGGFIREGHGDLHLANLTRLPEGIRAFDCIEFSPALRWIDVVNDIAFLFMDLDAKGRNDLSWWCLNAWLASSGDYRGLSVLRFYVLYRVMVRAKVALLRRNQLDGQPRKDADDDFWTHLKQAHDLVRPAEPRLLLTCGVSGSGKSWVAMRLAAAAGLVHVRSDVERKRLFGLGPEERSESDLGSGIYSAQASEQTYVRLQQIAASVLDSGHGVIVDATFLTAAQRLPFIALAQRRGIDVGVLEVTAGQATLERRVRDRARAGNDPSEADTEVLMGQLGQVQRPEAEEGAWVVEVENEQDVDIEALRARIVVVR
ncbi:MAG: aminoglycoside phosphotransferase [Gammaproteobacteria bacterium]|nr:MAG: aminoglycoside phosphotransferase [Gammaproteobacteria bacterium]